MDRATRTEIQRIAATTLRDAGLTEPPWSIERLQEHVELHRDYYDLSNPGFLDRAKHKLRIHGRKLVEIVNKVRLQAVLLFDESPICIDRDLPPIKHPWASCHETGHRILSWHKPFFFGDTAGRLLFLGDRFTQDARDVPPTIAGVELLATRCGASHTTTLRRYGYSASGAPHTAPALFTRM